MTPPVTLRAACTEKTCRLLMSGAWDGCAGNPFQCMPASIVQELLSCIKPEGPERSITHFRLLLTSGSLEHVVLPPGGDEAECVALLQMLSIGCQNLRTLSVRSYDSFDAPGRSVDEERALREVLRGSSKLENLHSGIPFVPDDLRNCSNLKTVRLHFGGEANKRFLDGITSALWKAPSESHPLRSLQVLALCESLNIQPDDDPFLDRKIAMLLDNCSQLTSLGFFLSSAALKALHDGDTRTHGTPRRFQLRSGCWGYKSYKVHPGYCEEIRVAAQSCPLVEILVICVPLPGVLRHLETLSNLTCLIITFCPINDIPEEEFCSFLHQIGPQLRHLSIYLKFTFNVNAVCRNCPNLRSLQVGDCTLTADEGLSFPNLERLNLIGDEVRPSDLFLLLSSCPRLKVLSVQEAGCLGDDDLQLILRNNRFAELEVVNILWCSLSTSGLRQFVQSASGLRLVCLYSFEIEGDDEVMRCVRDLNPSALCHSQDDFYELRDKYFPLGIYFTCWL